MNFTCYQKHRSDFDPQKCAAFFKKYNYDVVIDYDFFDDQSEIVIRDSHNKIVVDFLSYKMDKKLYNEMLEKYPNLDEEAKSYNAISEIEASSKQKKIFTIILLAYLQKEHGLSIFETDSTEAYVIKNLKAKIEAIQTEKNKSFNLQDFLSFAKKYKLPKILFTIALIVAYLIFDHMVYYGTTIIAAIIFVGLVVVWLNN